MRTQPPCRQPDGSDCKDRGTPKCRPNCDKWKEYERIHKIEREQEAKGVVPNKSWSHTYSKPHNIRSPKY